jgi:hypothetical protein
MSGIACQFPAQIAHRDAQEMYSVLILGAAPNFVNELMVSPYAAGVTNQNVQKMIFGSCQSDLFAAYVHLPRIEIDSQVPGREGFELGAPEGPPQGSANPREQLSRGTWLLNVIVGAQVVAGDYLGFCLSA